MTTTIYHNPRCSKSRQALELLERQGADIDIIRYLDTPPDAATLVELLERLGLSARELMRKGEDPYKELNLANPELSEAQLVQAMVDYPKLIERPIVIREGKAVIGRPPERVLELFE
ncbi:MULTISPECIES: arsenate reductase (glutaredoxin) [Pseudomonadaceae]|jgi:arsenate reductase|uniref:Arsenate reductase n=2 Tax=Pseudomonas abyssi TaxID=170540 RepID=A0ACD6B2J0_9PSED|nr:MULTISPECIES: arsenate reductase (glutaredoxin) [Pseudomonadaceae]MAC99472.1 arsenate reductase (glutaredoxin) [Pseudomonadales bacterium]MAG66398.1 arsenate reductase (glutaredoxin) [Pseudomonadales bacterium]PBK02675.1 arsenate reductase (glutaredoxin) [Pseudomonas abyssi]RGP52446.1 arsenate reductase [Halopseudomonas gallaeciensis]|tara:strand:+ start:17501 stop:17851 length:351 start_codon:yes stop_codon:yes gene_type:complete